MADTAGSNRAVVGLAEQVVRSRGRRDLKQLAGQVAAAMDRHGVLTDATAIAFRMLFALAFLSLTGLAFAGAVHLAGLIIAALFVIAAALLLSASGQSTPPALRLGETILRFGFSAVVLLFLVAMLLRFTTPAHLRVKWVTLGSSITIAIWLAASWLFGWYIANFAYRGYQQAFGILSLLIVVMTYLYVASIAFLVGAELDALLVTEATKRRR